MTSQNSNQPSQPSSLDVHCPNYELMDAIITTWIDGILILTKTGELVRRNSIAKQICDRIAQSPSNHIPKEIWRTCQVLIQGCNEYTEGPVVAESELNVKPHEQFRIRARWFDFGEHGNNAYILVILEDQNCSKRNLAITEVDRYGLSPREAEVWLLHRTGYTYREIAAELYIAVNTVKRHIKKIYAKQHLTLIKEEAYADDLAS